MMSEEEFYIKDNDVLFFITEPMELGSGCALQGTWLQHHDSAGKTKAIKPRDQSLNL